MGTRSFASAVRAASRRYAKLGAEAMLLDLEPATALALPAVIVLFANASCAESLAMVQRVSEAAAACAPPLALVPIAVMNVHTRAAAQLAAHLGVEIEGRGETFWLAAGRTLAHLSPPAEADTLRGLTMALAARAGSSRETPESN